MAGFDPYYKWLAIPPEEQPPHHYRLLGVVPFEPDADVIDTAAEQRMAYLRTCATGEHVAASQKLLNEVTAARLCLLNPQKKAAYDAELKAKLSAAATAAPGAKTASETVRAEPDPLDELDTLEAALPPRRRTEKDRSEVRRSPGRNKSSRSRILPAIGGAGLLVAIVVMALIFRGRGNNDEVTVEIPDSSTDDPSPVDPSSVDPSRGTTVAKSDPAMPTGPTATPNPPAGTFVRGKPGEPPVFGRPPTGTPPTGSNPTDVGASPVATYGPTPPVAVAPFDAAQAKALQEAWAKHLGEPVETTNSIGMRFALIPPGEFDMGESPNTVHVKISRPFRLGVHEVTQERWLKVMGTEPWIGKNNIPDSTDCPATYMKHHESRDFCRHLTELERAAGQLSHGEEYRLPTEAEWEFAARAGSTTPFLIGSDAGRLGDIAWYQVNTSGVGAPHPHVVGSKQPNVWGLHDVLGNVRESCIDWMGTLQGGTDPLGPATGGDRAARGGSYNSQAKFCVVGWRGRNPPGDRNPDLGLRVARTISWIPSAAPSEPPRPPRASDVPPPLVEKADPPTGADLDAAEAKVKEVFGADYAAAKKPDEKRGLAKKLVDHARRSVGTDDVGPRFVLLRDARTLAAETGDAATAMQALRELDRHFEVDVLALAVDLLFAATKAATSAADSAAVASAALDTIDRALADDAFDTADKLSPLVTGALRRTNDANLAQRAAVLRTRLTEAKAAYVGIDAARKTLATNADDPAAHLALGRWLCFVKQDWDKGLAHLAKSGDADLAKIAALEQSAPLTFADRLALADAWWTWIEKQPAKDRKPLHLAPHHWYRLAQPAATGLDRAKIDKRLADIGKLEVVRATSGAPGSPIGSSVPMPRNPVVDAPARNLVQPRLVDGKLAALNEWGKLEQVEGENVLLPTRFPSGPRDADRRAATAILKKHLSKFLLLTPDGTLHVRSSRGGNQEVQLPAQPFLVVSIFIRHGLEEADTENLSGLVGLTRFEVYEGFPAGKGIDRLAQSTSLRRVTSGYGTTTDETIENLSRLPELEVFSANGAGITAEGYARLGKFPRLTHLDLRYAGRLGDASMADLAQLGTLTHLALSGLTLTDAGLAHFANLRGLEELRLQNRRAISPVGIAVLRDLPKLRRIEFPECGSQFNDENLLALEGDESLRELVLNKCALTDAAFSSLLRIPNLEYANIAETQITAAGLAEFQRQRPKCRIVGKGK